METKALIFRTWDDLVFAHRNQAYGAYSIRRAYTKRVILGLGISVATIVLLLFVPGITSRFGDKVVMPTVKPDHPTIVLSDIIPPIRKAKPVKPQPTSQTTRTNTQIMVVSNTEVVTEQTEAVSTIENSEPEGEEGTGEAVEGTGTQISQLPLIVENQRMMNPEVMPSYEGGMEQMMKFIKKNLRYPAAPRRLGIDGTVTVSFVINGDGSVSEVTVLRGIHPACDEEVVRVISMIPGWRGGKQNGIPVSVKMALPVKFNLGN